MHLVVDVLEQTEHLEKLLEGLAKGNPTNKTIFAVVKDKETADKAVGVIRSICGDLNDPGKGIVFTIPVDFAEGLSK